MNPVVIDTAFGTLSYGVQGHGSPLILIHASGMGREKWGLLGSMMAAHHTVYTPNLLGYGQTGPWRAQGYGIAQEVEVLLALIEEIGTPVSILGHSFGGAVALYTALAVPHRVRHLALYEPTVFGLLARDDDVEARAEIDALTRIPDFFDPSPDALEDWLGTFVEYWSRAPVWAFTSRAQKDALLAVGPKVVAEVREVLTGGHGLEAARVSQSVLVMCGRRSTAAARRMAQLLVACLPRGAGLEIPRLGHMAPLHRPEAIAEAALAFFAGQEKTPAPS